MMGLSPLLISKIHAMKLDCNRPMRPVKLKWPLYWEKKIEWFPEVKPAITTGDSEKKNITFFEKGC